MLNKREKQARLLRLFRKVHRKTGAILFVFFLVIAISSLLLGWKGHSNGTLLPKTQNGVSSELRNWIKIDSLQAIAFQVLKTEVDPNIDLTISRIDARPDKGIVKFIFENHYWEVQLDGTTGKALAVSRRRSDLIENIHDGSILDKLLGTNSDIIKLFYTTIMGSALLIFTITGFWLWYGPKRMRRATRHASSL